MASKLPTGAAWVHPKLGISGRMAAKSRSVWKGRRGRTSNTSSHLVPVSVTTRARKKTSRTSRHGRDSSALRLTNQSFRREGGGRWGDKPPVDGL